jgi:hypothetical protein
LLWSPWEQIIPQDAPETEIYEKKLVNSLAPPASSLHLHIFFQHRVSMVFLMSLPTNPKRKEKKGKKNPLPVTEIPPRDLSPTQKKTTKPPSTAPTKIIPTRSLKEDKWHSYCENLQTRETQPSFLCDVILTPHKCCVTHTPSRIPMHPSPPHLQPPHLNHPEEQVQNQVSLHSATAPHS